MMVAEHVVDLARFQFALTALYHFLFVPLTLGLAFLLAIMESVYVMTGKEIYRDMTKFWGKLFAINFAMGVTTGLTMEFQFGTTWAYYAHYVGDIFGAPLAVEGLMAFFLESTFVGLFLFGWDRLSKVQHLTVTWLVALGANLSALWILIANAWMQNPVGAHFNLETMRMELSSFTEVLFNPVAQVKFVHTVAAGYTTGAIFVLAISAWYLLKGRDLAFARRSFAAASGFGLAAALSVIVLGDETGYTVGEVQKMKLATIEAEWETQKPPAAFNVFAIPDSKARKNEDEVKIPALLGMIATRSLDEPVIGIKPLVARNEQRIRRGIVAYGLLDKVRKHQATPEELKRFNANKDDLGYALLLRRYTADIPNASPALINKAAWDTVPRVAPLFWSFRIMVLLGFLMLLLFALAFYYNAKGVGHTKRWLLVFAVIALPFPWIAAELGWVVAEYGRQPWAIAHILPTRLGTSTLTAGDLYTSLAGFIIFYTTLAVIEIYLMLRYIRWGPSSLHTGRYHFERKGGAGQPRNER